MLDRARIGAVVRKELRSYRRNRFIVVTMAVLPIVFFISPSITLLRLTAHDPISVIDRQVGVTMFLMLIVPAMLPATIAAYSVVGERDQGTLEPLLTTPIRREELIVGKALAAVVPALIVSYVFFLAFALLIVFAATPAAGTALTRPSQLLAQLLFTPLLAVWSIWVCLAISARSSDVRVAQQLGTLASLPPLGVVSLFAFQVIDPTVWLAVALGLVLLVFDLVAWRFVSVVFDRERLITGIKPARRGLGASPR